MLRIISTILVLVLGGAVIIHNYRLTTNNQIVKTKQTTNNLQPTPLRQGYAGHATSRRKEQKYTYLSDWKEVLWGTVKNTQTYPEVELTTDNLQQTITQEKTEISKQTPATAPKIIVTEKTLTDETLAVKELHTYGNTLGALLKTFYADTTRDKNALESLSPTTIPIDFNAIRTLGNTYATLATTVKNIPAPQTAYSLNLQLASAYFSLAESITALAKDEPNRPAVQELKNYSSAIVQSFVALTNLATFFKNQNVTFIRGEGGDMFYSN